jgi:hypothetical protein
VYLAPPFAAAASAEQITQKVLDIHGRCSI